MPFDSLKDAIADIQAGKIVILVDDENRENEGDLAMAAEKATPDAVTPSGGRQRSHSSSRSAPLVPSESTGGTVQ